MSDFKPHSWKRNLEALLSIVDDIAYDIPSTFRAKPASVLFGKGEGLRANQLQITTDLVFAVSDPCILPVQ